MAGLATGAGMTDGAQLARIVGLYNQNDRRAGKRRNRRLYLRKTQFFAGQVWGIGAVS
jgi:hypothetical protein